MSTGKNAHPTAAIGRSSVTDGEGFDAISASDDTTSTCENSYTLPGAESGAVGAQNTLIDANLAEVIRAWPKLPAIARNAIVAMVRAHC